MAKKTTIIAVTGDDDFSEDGAFASIRHALQSHPLTDHCTVEDAETLLWHATRRVLSGMFIGGLFLDQIGQHEQRNTEEWQKAERFAKLALGQLPLVQTEPSVRRG